MHYERDDGTFEEVRSEKRTYDSADRIVQRQSYDAPPTVFEHDGAGNVTRTTDPTGVWHAVEYDAMGRPIARTDENGHRSQLRFNLAGQLVRTIDPSGLETVMTYDPVGNLESSTVDPDDLALETRFEYSPSGRQKKRIDPNAVEDPTLRNAQDATEYREYDELGRITYVLDAEDGETHFAYDLLGNRTRS